MGESAPRVARAKTARLRAMLDRLGMEYTEGHRVGLDGWLCADSVTNVYPLRDEACEPITFAEDADGELFVYGDITPEMAVALAVTASIGGE